MRSTALTCSYSLPRASLWTERAKISSDLLFNNKNTPGMTVKKKVESAKKKKSKVSENIPHKRASLLLEQKNNAEPERTGCWNGSNQNAILSKCFQATHNSILAVWIRRIVWKKLQFWRNVCQRKEKNTIMNSSCKPRSSYLDLSIVRWSSINLKTFRV